MTLEFTFYTLFIMLSIAIGVIFQFCLGQIKKTKKDILKVNASINKIHQELQHSRRDSSNKSQNKRNTERFSRKRGSVLTGCLELEHQGARAQTNAIFYVKEEK